MKCNFILFLFLKYTCVIISLKIRIQSQLKMFALVHPKKAYIICIFSLDNSMQKAFSFKHIRGVLRLSSILQVNHSTISFSFMKIVPSGSISITCTTMNDEFWFFRSYSLCYVKLSQRGNLLVRLIFSQSKQDCHYFQSHELQSLL